jgi:hypothetical protein
MDRGGVLDPHQRIPVQGTPIDADALNRKGPSGSRSDWLV